MSIDPNPYTRRPPAQQRGPDGLADVLERILDKGLVVAGDIQINLLDIELITIKVRLLLASADTAQQMGIDWWKHDPFLTSKDRELAQENAVLRDRVDQLEAAMGRKLVAGEPSPGDVVGEAATDDVRRGQPRPTAALGNGHGDAGGAQGEGPDGDYGADTPRFDVDEVILEPEAGQALRVTPATPASGDDAGSEGVEQDQDQDQDQEQVEDEAWLDEATIGAMTKRDLQAELAARELPTSGNKPVLQDRLLDALADEWEEVDGDDG